MALWERLVSWARVSLIIDIKKERRKGKDVKKENTPGTAGGPGGRDQTLAVKSIKNG